MDFPPQKQPPRPTLEDLLRFKSAERPAPEFWVEFERGLRQKQLAALLNRPQGWARMRPMFVRGLRWTVPIAAAAAVAVVLVKTPSTPTVPNPSNGVASSVPATVMAPAEHRPTTVAEVAAATVAPPASAEAPLVVAAAAAETPALMVSEPVEIAPLHSNPEQVLSWTAAALGTRNDNSALYHPVAHTVRRARETGARVSSWTSSLAKTETADTWSASDSQLLQLTALDLRVSTAYADNLPAARAVAGAPRRVASLSDREFRELESRFDAKSSRMSVRF